MKYTIVTLGCKVNQFESGSLAQSLKENGWEYTPEDSHADACIINTCTVTEKAAAQSRQAIRQAVRAHPRACIIVTGCYAETEAEAVRKISGVHHVVGHSEKHAIPTLLAGFKKGLQLFSPDFIPASGSCEESSWQPFPLPLGDRTRPFLKIQDGCNTFCTYCIVPHARGRSRSMPALQVLEGIRQYSRSGYKEVVLTGIHLGAWGLDLSPKTSLSVLLKEIEGLRLIQRLRLSSIEPGELTKDIIRLISDSECICHHFHIPLQSGDDGILKRMNRPYTTSLFRERIETVHALLPGAAIGVDTLVGFPGETQKAFQNTYDLIQGLPVTYLHVFPFSPRQKTPACKFPDQVEPPVIQERCQQMRQLGRTKKRDFYKKFLGKTLPVLVEGKRDKDTGFLKGTTHNYIPVIFEGKVDLENRIVNVRLEKLNRSDSVSGVTNATHCLRP